MNGLIDISRDSIIFLVFSAIIFIPLEAAFPAKNQPKLKKTDLIFFWLYPSFGMWTAAVVLYAGALFLRGFLPAAWIDAVHAQPAWLQLCEALLMAETWIYVTHRLCHEVDFLWRFHKLHHTVTEMTWTATFRQHPVDFLLIVLGANLPAMVLGIDLQPIMLLIAIERLYTVAIHANITFGLGGFGRFLSSPRFHHLHHHDGRHGCNYAGMLAFLDVVGKSYK